MRSFRTSIAALTAIAALGLGAGTAAAAPLSASKVVSDQLTPAGSGSAGSTPFALTTAAVTSPVAKAGHDLPVSITVASGCATSSLSGTCSAIDITLTYQSMSSGQWGEVAGRLFGAGGTTVLSIPGADVQALGLSYTATATQSCGSFRATATSPQPGGTNGIVFVAA